MSKYVINLGNDVGNTYYIGKWYIVEGEEYPCYTNEINKAKYYTSKRRAENAVKSIERKYGMGNCSIVEVGVM